MSDPLTFSVGDPMHCEVKVAQQTVYHVYSLDMGSLGCSLKNNECHPMMYHLSNSPYLFFLSSSAYLSFVRTLKKAFRFVSLMIVFGSVGPKLVMY